MKSSCILHPEREPIAILRQSYIELCGGDRCAAMLLSSFEYWHNVKLDQSEQEIARARADADYKPNLSLWFYKSADDIRKDLLGLYGRNVILDAIQILLSKGYIEIKEDSRSSMSRLRFFLFKPDAVNADLAAMPAAPDRRGPNAEGLKVNARQFKKGRSENPANEGRTTVEKGTLDGLNIDALPYTETTSSEVTNPLPPLVPSEKVEEDEDLKPLAEAIAEFVVATPEAVRSLYNLAVESDGTLSAADVAVAVRISVPPGYQVRHWRFFVTALPKTVLSTRFLQELKQWRRHQQAQDESRAHFQREHEERINQIASKPEAELTEDDRWYIEQAMNDQEREELKRRRGAA